MRSLDLPEQPGGHLSGRRGGASLVEVWRRRGISHWDPAQCSALDGKVFVGQGNVLVCLDSASGRTLAWIRMRAQTANILWLTRA